MKETYIDKTLNNLFCKKEMNYMLASDATWIRFVHLDRQSYMHTKHPFQSIYIWNNLYE